MLTQKQMELFKLLEWPVEKEKEIRTRHRLVKELGAAPRFTDWLGKCLQNKWRCENERLRPIYLGD